MQLLVIFWSAISFAAISSYINVLIERGWRKSLQPRSICDSCGKPLKPLRMIPVFSAMHTWLFHKSQSYCCGKKISAPKYFFTELLGAITGALLASFFYQRAALIGFQIDVNFWLEILVTLPVVLTFLYLAQQDIWYYEISVPVLGVLTILICLGALILPSQAQSVFGNLALSWGAIATGVVAALIVGGLILISKGRGLGSGDMLLLFVMGLNLGSWNLFWGSQIAIYLATIFGVVYAAYIKKFKGIIIPLVPFLYLGWLSAIVFQKEILQLFQQLK